MESNTIKPNYLNSDLVGKKGLDSLKMNRFLYKAEVMPPNENAMYMSSNIYSEQDMKKNKGKSEEAKSIMTGSVLVSCFVRTSNKNTRVELVPVSFNETGEDVFGEDTFEDALIAWRDVNQPAVVIDQHGIWTDEFFVEGEMTILGELIVVGDIEYNGSILPQSFYGAVLGDGTAATLPSGWSSVKNSDGVYTVTHNLGLTSIGYAVVASALETSGTLIRILMVRGQNSDSFVIDIRDETNTPVDSIFTFHLMTTN